MWVVDFTYVSTWQQTAYKAFVTDVDFTPDRGLALRDLDANRAALNALELALGLRARREVNRVSACELGG